VLYSGRTVASDTDSSVEKVDDKTACGPHQEATRLGQVQAPDLLRTGTVPLADPVDDLGP
jgi:hypothetical protein